MRLFLCPNRFTDQQAEQAVRCLHHLEQGGGHEVALSEADSLRLFGDTRYMKFDPAGSDLLVSLGGDGAVLRAARVAMTSGKPLLGINSGRLGYLCAMDYEELLRFNALLGECTPSVRTILELRQGDTCCQALNDVIIGKSNFGSTVDLTVGIDGEEAMEVRGDGLIIATPTGSTAYNLSAGGPTLDPETPSLVLTPICPHSRHASPLVISDRRTITVQERDNNAQVYVDGVHLGKIQPDLTVRKDEKPVTLLVRKGRVLKGF
ncbi:MAG: NAD(+)/NADH kinase [Clostridia bacterium]|nr:NAD(+)/NADH kinase [Clostridia bacterium]